MSPIAPRCKGWRPEAPSRKGWCPGALRPMETGDGLLARVRASGGRLALGQAAAIADAAIGCGNGAIGLSARANLQIRGVTERSLADLQARLAAVDLIDADPEVERLRNIVASPLSDFDPAAAIDLADALAALEKRLAEDVSLRRLPAKFGFVLDARGRLPLADIDADVRFEAERGADGVVFVVHLAGRDAIAATCRPGEVGEAAARLAQAFLALAGTNGSAARRMRALVERHAAGRVFDAAGLEAEPRLRAQRRASLHQVLGGHAFGSAIVAGFAAAFGIIDAGRFKALIERAKELGASGLRLTPWRAFFIVGLDPRRAASIVATAARLGFIASTRDPRLRVAVCPGAPACLHAVRPLRDDAERFAAQLPEGEGIALHVSGCAKGCARSHPTAVTLTATERGYDLVLNGKAGDAPARRDLSSAEAAALLAADGDQFFADMRRMA
jgi:precorrin-3B synthase